jgi:hypothetical protein
MTLGQIKDQIWSLRPSDRIELYRWLDYGMAAGLYSSDLSTSDFCSRIGADRAREIRHAIEQKGKVNVVRRCAMDDVRSADEQARGKSPEDDKAEKEAKAAAAAKAEELRVALETKARCRTSASTLG